jgi:hypothetical protein
VKFLNGVKYRITEKDVSGKIRFIDLKSRTWYGVMFRDNSDETYSFNVVSNFHGRNLQKI